MERTLKSPIAWFVAVLVIFAIRNGIAATHGQLMQPHKLDAFLLGYIAAWLMLLLIAWILIFTLPLLFLDENP